MRVIAYDEKGLREEIRLVKTIAEDDRYINVYYVNMKTCCIECKKLDKVLIASIYVKVWEEDYDY